MSLELSGAVARDLAEIHRALAGHHRLLVAFSGGLDSTVMLHQLALLRERILPDLQIRAMHIHHGLSPRADEWVTHCQSVCRQWQIPLSVAYVHLPSGGQGIEGEARKARYQALRAEIHPGEVLVTAQHQDDQCETFLLALKRGSGPAGLAAMPRQLSFANSLLVRPLLNISREELEDWAERHQLVWIEDESNQQDCYDRNFLRLRVLPLLHQRWPHFMKSVSRSAALCGEQEQLLDELLAEQLSELMDSEGTLAIGPLCEASEAKRAALLRRWFGFHQARMPSRDTLGRVWSEVAMSREDANPRLRLGTHEVRRYQERLYWVKVIAWDKSAIIAWPPPYDRLYLPDLGILSVGDSGTQVRAPHPQERVSVRFQAAGKLHIVERDKGRSLKKIWQELQIAPWLRERNPLIFYDEQLICAPGLFVTRAGQPEQHDSWFVRWQAESL